jgi:hypothetical protein
MKLLIIKNPKPMVKHRKYFAKVFIIAKILGFINAIFVIPILILIIFV